MAVSSAVRVQLHIFAEFNRTDGRADAVGHGLVAPLPPPRASASPVCAKGPSRGQPADAALGASDGQVIDRHGLHWLIGFEGAQQDETRTAPDRSLYWSEAASAWLWRVEDSNLRSFRDGFTDRSHWPLGQPAKRMPRLLFPVAQARIAAHPGLPANGYRLLARVPVAS
jgi:PhnB protein